MIQEGHGCRLCVEGTPVETILSPAGRVKVCGGCLVRGFPGTTAAWWQRQHRHFADHLGNQLDEALEVQAGHRALQTSRKGA